jgi:hypothetical protein
MGEVTVLPPEIYKYIRHSIVCISEIQHTEDFPVFEPLPKIPSDLKMKIAKVYAINNFLD